MDFIYQSTLDTVKLEYTDNITCNFVQICKIVQIIQYRYMYSVIYTHILSCAYIHPYIHIGSRCVYIYMCSYIYNYTDNITLLTHT